MQGNMSKMLDVTLWIAHSPRLICCQERLMLMVFV